MSTPTLPGTDTRLAYLDASGTEDPDPAMVGAKAANLMRSANAGLPVPSGFVLSTAVCSAYEANGGHLDDEVVELVQRGLHHVERASGRRFGGQRHPLLVSVRSGAAASMPGMLETVLDVGLCERTLPGLLRMTGDPVFVWDSYRRLIESYAEVVAGCDLAPFRAVLDEALAAERVPVVGELDVAALRALVVRLLEVYRLESGQPFPEDPFEQLMGALEAVLRSWRAPRAVEYRRLEGLDHLAGTAVTVQAMTFGNLGAASGSGVGFTRDPATGADRLYFDFLVDAQGEDVVAGRRRVGASERRAETVTGLLEGLEGLRRILESVFGDAQDFEFTVEDGTLWLLQTRTAKRTPWAALQIACDLVGDGRIDEPTALDRLSGYDLDTIVRGTLAMPAGTRPLALATPAGTGVAAGRIALEVDDAQRLAETGASVVLVRESASTGDIAALAVCRGLLTATGARTSHAAVVARQLGVVCLVGCEDLVVDPPSGTIRFGSTTLAAGDPITLDADGGQVFSGALDVIEERPSDLVARVRSWMAEREGQQPGSRPRRSSDL